MEKFADFAIRRRLPILIGITLITLFFLFQLINPLGFLSTMKSEIPLAEPIRLSSWFR